MPRLSRSTPAVILLSLAASLPACAPKRIDLPTGAGTPYAEAARAYAEAVKECRGVRTMQATLGLSGRAGTTALRGNVDAGFEAPDRIRLEGRHPLGRPVFILVAGGGRSTLYMPRDNRVLRDVRSRVDRRGTRGRGAHAWRAAFDRQRLRVRRRRTVTGP